jgi:hypothetical protein
VKVAEVVEAGVELMEQNRVRCGGEVEAVLAGSSRSHATECRSVVAVAAAAAMVVKRHNLPLAR